MKGGSEVESVEVFEKILTRLDVHPAIAHGLPETAAA